MAEQRIQWGGPFAGYVSSVRRNRTSSNIITDSSRDVLVDPAEGSISRRLGSVIVGDTASSGVEVTGLLPAKWSARPRRGFALESPSLSGGYPTHAVLFGRDNARESDGGETGNFGTVYLRNGSTNQQVLSDYSTTHYPTAGGTYNQVHRYKVVPFWYDSGAGGYSRGTRELTQRFLAAGSRDVLQTEERLYLPGLYSTPVKWNKRINATTTSDTDDVRVFPTGPVPPLWCPHHTATSSASADGTWKDGDTFYLSVLFQQEDGSYTMFALPRGKTSVLTSGLGLVTVGTPGGTSRYRELTYAIPLGPDGTIARILVRTSKQNLAASTDPLTIAPGDLKILGVVRNNTQTSYIDPNGNDGILLEDDNVVRLDHVMPRRARWLGTGDQRVLAGYTLPNQCAIFLAPLSSSAERDLNALDTSNTIYGSTYYMLRVTATALELLVGSAGSITGTNSISLSGISLQDLVDTINATTLASNSDRWVAQLAPGADGTQNATDLVPTTFTVNNCTASGATLTTSNSFADIPVGYAVTGTGISAGTYVVSKQSNTSLTLNQSATSSGVNLTFACDTGDYVAAGNAYGYIRVFGPTYPAALYFNRSALRGYDRPDKQSVYFTISSPGAAVSGVSLAPNAWVAGNRRFEKSRLGPMQGFADVEGAAVVAYSRSVKLFINVRGVNTGEDFDYRMLTINDRRGSVGPPVAGDGWAAYPTQHGIVVTDKNRAEKVVSLAIHNPANGRGDLAYELGKSREAAESDSEDGMFYLSVYDTFLCAAYRSSGSASTPDRRIVYDFSPGIDASGLEELFDTDNKTAYPWSAPFRQKSGLIFDVVKSGGAVRLMCSETNAGATGDGRVQQIDMSGVATDDGVAVNGLAYLATVFRPDFAWLSPQRIHVEHFTPDSSVALAVVRNTLRTGGVSVVLPTSTGGSIAGASIIELAQTTRSNGEVVEWLWTDGSADTTASLWKLVLEMNAPEAYT